MMYFLLILFLASIAFALSMIELGHSVQQRVSFLHDPVYVPSSEKAVLRMLKLAHPKKKEKMIDFGSGDGRLVIAFAKKGCQAIGYEVNPFLVARSRRRIHKAHVENNANILWKSFWQAKVRDCDIVVLYTTASIMPRLEKKLRKELKKGARVVSQEFSFPHWKAKKRVGNLYLYQK